MELPTEALRRRALVLLAKVSKENPRLGKPCGYVPSTGNPWDCRKLYFDEEEDVNPRYRIVYRLMPDEDSFERIEVIRISLKVEFQENGDVDSIYHQVGRALGRAQ